MFDLTGKRALVTGSTQGIGLAIAQMLGKCGATVYVNGSTSMEKCEKAASTVQNGIPVLADLRKGDAAKTLYAVTGPVDILILNASVQYRTPWDKIEDMELDDQWNLNFRASLKLIQTYAADMKDTGWGRIILVGSVQQHKPHKDMAVYAATKAAGMNLVQNLAAQLAPFGITVNNLSPGVIATPRNEAALSDPEYAQKVYTGIPAGYAGTPEDCAGAALLLCSNEGRYITGIDLIVDGGMHL